MLVLSRKKHESLLIEREDGEPIVVRVMHISPTTVKLGVEAARSVSVARGEIQERLDAASLQRAREEGL